MALKIKIKHNVSGKVLPLHLKYDDPNTNFPEISVDMRDSVQDVTLSNWNVGADGIDAEKIKISEVQYQDGNDVYKINSVNIGIDAGPDTASEDVEDEMSHRDPSTITEPTCDDSLTSNWDAIVAAHNAKNYTERTRLIKEDPTKFFYDRSYDIRHTSYNETHYTDAEFAEKYGSLVSSGFLLTKAGVLSYGSLYFGPVLIEANSRYGKAKDWEKSTLMTQVINEEGRKNGVTSHGYMKNNQGTQVLGIRVPDLKDEVIVKNDLYSGVESNSSILTVCFVPSYSEASTAYRPASGVVYIDDVQINSTRLPFVRVRINNGEHVVRVEDTKYGGKTNWNTLGNHHITTPLYSDNILKIVLFNDDEDHGIYPNLYLQAKNNRWGLPCSMFENGGSETPSGSDDPSVTPPAGSEVVPISLRVRYIQNSDGTWAAAPMLNSNNNSLEYPVTFKRNGTVLKKLISHNGYVGTQDLNYQGTVGVVDKFDVVPDPYVLIGNNAYEIAQVDESYDVYADNAMYCWAEPSNKESLNFDYSTLDGEILYGRINTPTITVPSSESTAIVLDGDIETAFYTPINASSPDCNKTTLTHNLLIEETAWGYRRCINFKGYGQKMIGPLRATLNGSEQYTMDMPASLKILDSNYEDITSNLMKRKITYQHNGSSYTGYVYITPNEVEYTRPELYYLVYSGSELINNN